jgi:hypothetical protein
MYPTGPSHLASRAILVRYSTSKVTRLPLEHQQSVVRFGQRQEDFVTPQHPDSVAYPTCYPVGTRGYFPSSYAVRQTTLLDLMPRVITRESAPLIPHTSNWSNAILSPRRCRDNSTFPPLKLPSHLRPRDASDSGTCKFHLAETSQRLPFLICLIHFTCAIMKA